MACMCENNIKSENSIPQIEEWFESQADQGIPNEKKTSIYEKLKIYLI